MQSFDLDYLINEKSKKYGEILQSGKSNVFTFNAEQHKNFSYCIQQHCPFLSLINLFPVPFSTGKKIIGTLAPYITGRQENGRNIAFPQANNDYYQLVETDSGFLIPWQLFDQFAFMKENFEQLYDNIIFNQIGLDMLQIGWNGHTVAINTSSKDLSDVNKGWLTLLKEQKPENFKSKGKHGDTVKIFGEDADFTDLNKLAIYLRQRLDIHHQQRNDLVFLVGIDLLAHSPGPILENSMMAEHSALNNRYLLNTFGGLKTFTPPNFPPKGACVTTLNNLSIYTVENSGRYSIRNDEDRQGIITSYYREQGYVIEDLGLISAIDHNNVILN
ncbi:P2 family phage major capsid protein [Volucribacter psittacicida]|uniref:P2 family phage major capsid protein n=1 Tax=Volucribacter psittacicida TaxID=203482 RepID=A0A4R1FYP7_9PAST|nr:phage major capsid protein, P2 family [Volucribacter psittacicida]TCJ97958.1 P2 family phage major capsid protein [Volucribacter psittacicida]